MTHRLSSRAPAVLLLLAAILLPLATSASGQDRHPDWGSNMWEPGPSTALNLQNMTPAQRQRMLRSWTFMHEGSVPEDYLKATNTVGYTVKAIAAGGPLYVAQCRQCHGDTGLGNGELAPDLTPSPALLAYLMQQPIAVDQYLLWTISEGGKQFGTAMPAFKTVLTQEQIWQIVAYLRAGFPALEDTPTDGSVAPPVQTDEPSPKPKPGG
jgi:mono/diheme cytochrome c family protein